MKITIIGAGYVGLSLAILISRKYKVSVLDIDTKKVDLINNKISPIKDKDITYFLKTKRLKLEVSSSSELAISNANYVIIATPTNYDVKKGSFDTSSIEKVIKQIIKYNKNVYTIIKSTVPLGFTDRMRSKYNKENIVFLPEFLRESKALYDNLNPSRVIIGDNSKTAKKFANILTECADRKKKDIPIIMMSSKEAEAVKLFSNTYLAMRIAFFNELDSLAESHHISSEKIISGVSADPRIGNFYNNPSFGYGGYCLPKDTKQLLDDFSNIPNKIINAVVESNQTRKEFIVNSILNKDSKTVGVYRLIMKNDSDNFRESAVLDIIKLLIKRKTNVIVYEPLAKDEFSLEGVKLVSNFENFVSKSDIIIANRLTKELENYKDIVYSRDIFQNN